MVWQQSHGLCGPDGMEKTQRTWASSVGAPPETSLKTLAHAPAKKPHTMASA